MSPPLRCQLPGVLPDFTGRLFFRVRLRQQKFVIVFPVAFRRGIAVNQTDAFGQFRIVPDGPFQFVHAVHARFVIVKAQADLRNLRVIIKVLEHGAGRGSAQRQIIAVSPVAAAPLDQRG